MRTLFLLRHAKSSWDDSQQRDYDRPLNPRGEAAASLMGRFLRAQGLRTDHLLVSSAVRTRQTWSLVNAVWRLDVQPQFEDAIYMATVDTLLGLVQAAPKPARTMMMIGHNPGFEDLAFKLVIDGDSGGLDLLDQGFKTAAFAELTFDVADWNEIAPKSATLQRFITPRSLDRSMDNE
jgi:phosphohistidine phosphatase